MIKHRHLVMVIAAIGDWQAGSGIWIHAKAVLAQALLERAWQQGLASGQPVRPWPWADTWPVARLQIPSRQLDLVVLQGDSGRSLAFGPGLAAGSAVPGKPGSKLISGHRDTHFAALAGIRKGEILELETRDGRFRYRISETLIIDSRRNRLADNPLQDELILSTCYPFDAIQPGGPLRFVVRAERLPAQRGTSIARIPALPSAGRTLEQPLVF